MERIRFLFAAVLERRVRNCDLRTLDKLIFLYSGHGEGRVYHYGISALMPFLYKLWRLFQMISFYFYSSSHPFQCKSVSFISKTHMITDRIRLHSVLLPLLLHIFCNASHIRRKLEEDSYYLSWKTLISMEEYMLPS